jgi:Sodium/hydrogen exchanger family
MTGGSYQAFIYLAAALVAVPLAKRLGLGSVLGYLLAGVVIGPFALRLVEGGGDVMHFAEFGVVMLLFLIGLELRPALLWLSHDGPYASAARNHTANLERALQFRCCDASRSQLSGPSLGT